MSDEQILMLIAEAVREETDRPEQPVHRDMTAASIPGWDSLAHTRIMMNIESRIGREMDIDATYRAATIQDLIPLIREALAA